MSWAVTPLDAVVRAALAVRWAPLPVGPDDEHGGPRGVAPIYWVSRCGRVAWVAPDAPPGRRCGVKCQRPERRGRRKQHWRVNVSVRWYPGRRRAWRTIRVHRLVAAAWRAPGSGPLVRHLDGDAAHNDVDNLAWGTASENLRDAYDLGERCCSAEEGEVYIPDPVLGF